MPEPAPAPPTLARHIGLFALVVYGVGDMLGSGVYALIGRVAGKMGNAAWLAFLLSAAAAVLTGLSYACLGSRHPRAAGVAFCTQRAFRRGFLTYLVGLGVVASGVTSMAVQTRTFTGYFLGLLDVPSPDMGGAGAITVMLGFLAVLTLINFRGIKESLGANLLCTAVEAGGLLFVVAVGVRFWGGVDYLEAPPVVEGGGAGAVTLPLVLGGAVLTFYAFIGFEDMINVTEEVKDPARTFPKALLIALACTTALYLAIAVTAVSVVPWSELGKSGQPMVDVVSRAAPWLPRWVFSFIALFAITNTALLNYVMGSRLLYGMARQGFLPRALGDVHPTRRTPHKAIFALLAVTTVLALSGDISTLASATSVILLGVFLVVHASLLALRRREGEPKGAFEVPWPVPVLGMAVCAAVLAHATPAAFRIAGFLLLGVAALYAITRPKHLREEDLAEAGRE